MLHVPFRLPDSPATLTVYVPVVAVLLAASVRVLLPVVLLGLNVAVTPVGRPDADRVTLALKPFCGVTVMVLVPLAPWKMLRLLGDAESVKLPLLLTVRVIVTELVNRPEVPVTVMVAAPTAAVLLVVNVSVLVLVALAGLKVAVTPLGKPEADKPTLPVKPFTGLTVIVAVPPLPCVMVKLLDEVVRKKDGTGPVVGQFVTRLVAFSVPMPVAKSQPIFVPYAGLKELLEVESTPWVPGPEGS